MRRFHFSSSFALPFAFLLQTFCAGFFVYDILLTLVGADVRPLPWKLREILELAATFGLLSGLIFGGFLLRHTLRETAETRSKLRAASGEFAALLEDKFTQWRLTPAERDVALFSIKGLDIAQIAQIRSTSQGTTKAQLNAIYRKSSTTNRSGLLSIFIDELMDESLIVSPSKNNDNRG